MTYDFLNWLQPETLARMIADMLLADECAGVDPLEDELMQATAKALIAEVGSWAEGEEMVAEIIGPPQSLVATAQTRERLSRFFGWQVVKTGGR